MKNIFSKFVQKPLQIAIVCVLIGSGLYIASYFNKDGNTIIVPGDMKTCPNGLSTSRNPNTGEFVCPDSKSETINLKNYKNDEYGFEFKYPNNYSIVSEGYNSTGNNYYIAFRWVGMPENGMYYSLSVYNIDNIKAWDDYLLSRFEFPPDEPTKYDGPINISKNPTINKYIITGYYGELFTYYNFIGKEYKVYFGFKTENNGTSNVNIDNVYNQMTDSIKDSFTWLK